MALESAAREVVSSLPEQLTLCPSCGRKMSVQSTWLRIDTRTNHRILERVLYCNSCRLKIRQSVNLTLLW